MSALDEPSQQLTLRKDVLVKWTSFHQKLFKQVLQTVTWQDGILEQIIEIFEQDPRFDFGGLTVDNDVGVIGLKETQNITKKRLQASQLFLDLWRYLLDRVDVANYSQRLLCFKYILAVMKRREFHPKYFQHLVLNKITEGASQSSNSLKSTDLSYINLSPTAQLLGSSPPQKKGFLSSIFSNLQKNNVDELSKKVLSNYKELLVKTQEYAVKTLRTKKHENIFPELFRFCAGVLAVNCLRLLTPEQTDIFTSQFVRKYFPQEYLSPEVEDIITKNMENRSCFMKKIKYVPSVAGLSDLLGSDDDLENVEDKKEDEEKNAVIKKVFCYYKFMFDTDPLDETTQNKSYLNKVSELLKDTSIWLPTIHSTEDFFPYFFSEFVDQISKIMKHDTSNHHWKTVPGYVRLMKYFSQLGRENLVQHISLNFEKSDNNQTTNKQEQKVKELEETVNMVDGHENLHFKQWLSCSLIALRNPLVINILLELFFSNTNGYNPDQVFYTLDWADKWFQEVRQLEHSFQQYLLYRNHKHRHTYFYLESSNIELFIGALPQNFNYEFFELSIERLLNTDHFQIVSRTLIFIYNILDLFNGKARLKFLGHNLIRDHFYDLFLHWSIDIRNIFYRIILFKLQRFSSSVFLEYKPQLNSLGVAGKKILTTRGRSNSGTGWIPPKKDSPNINSPPIKKEKLLITVEDLGRRSIDDIEPRRTSLSGTRPSIDQLISSSGIKKKGRKEMKFKKEEKQIKVDDEMGDEFQRVEESIDLVLKSKVDTYLEVLRTILNNPKDALDMIEDNPTLDVPIHLRPYIESALNEYEAIENECTSWKKEVTELLVNNSKSSVIKVSEIPYPIIKYPRFTLQSDKL
ncbi:hypothetical protein ABK040_015351 [Willaertia magna]